MPPVVIDQVNKIVIAEGFPSLLIFYDPKGNPVEDDSIKIVVVGEATYNKEVYA